MDIQFGAQHLQSVSWIVALAIFCSLFLAGAMGANDVGDLSVWRVRVN
jgi:Flp pilus assembly protein protease CpaA